MCRLTSTLGAALPLSRRVRRGAVSGGTRERSTRGEAPVTGTRVTAPPPRVVMFPHPDLIPRHQTRLGTLTGLELGDPGLGGGEPHTELRDQPLELGHGLLEVPELAAGGTRGARKQVSQCFPGPHGLPFQVWGGKSLRICPDFSVSRML